jgi:hypothetical protein
MGKYGTSYIKNEDFNGIIIDGKSTNGFIPRKDRLWQNPTERVVN